MLLPVGNQPGDLHIDRRRQSEIQHLRRDIRRREIAHQLRKLFGKRFANLDLVTIAGMMMTFLERDENLSVGRANQRAVA